MANILPGDFWDADQRVKPDVPLGNGKTGYMYHLGRGPSWSGRTGETAVDTIYMDPMQLMDLFKGMGTSQPTGQQMINELNYRGLKPDVDYRMLPHQISTGVRAADQNPAVGNGRALWNALVRGSTNLVTSGQAGNIRNAINLNNVTQSAYDVGGAGDRVTDLAAELEKLRRGDLIGQTEETILSRAPMVSQIGLPGAFTMAAGRGYYPLGGYTRFVRDENDPTYVEDMDALKQAQASVDAQQKYNEETKRERQTIENLKGVFRYPPRTLSPGGRESGDPRLIDPDYFEMARWTLSMTPEQRAAVTPEILDAKVKQMRIARRSKDIVDAFMAKAKTETFLKDYSGGSAASKTYGAEGAGYGDVWDEHGLAGLTTLLAEQGLESAPSTAATMLATTVAGLATGGSGAAVALAMGGTTAWTASGSNFTNAFREWAANQNIPGGIKLEELGDRDSVSYKNLMTIANNDPVLFMQQMDKMANEGDKRAIAEGVVTIALNKAGDFVTGKVMDKAPKGWMKEGSPIWAARGSLRRPSQLFSKEVWSRSLGPKLAHAGLHTSWEAVEEGLTDVMTSIAVGDDIDLKQALSSFLVGGMMGGASNFVGGRANVDDPMAEIRTKVLNNEGGIDEVAAQIAKNTGMDPKRAKAAIIRAKHMMDQFDELMAKQDPKKRRDPAFRKQMLDWYLQGARKVDKGKFLDNQQADQQQIALANARSILNAHMEEFKTQQLEAVTPGNVKPDPMIKASKDFIFNQNSNPAPGYDPARYR